MYCKILSLYHHKKYKESLCETSSTIVIHHYEKHLTKCLWIKQNGPTVADVKKWTKNAEYYLFTDLTNLDQMSLISCQTSSNILTLPNSAPAKCFVFFLESNIISDYRMSVCKKMAYEKPNNLHTWLSKNKSKYDSMSINLILLLPHLCNTDKSSEWNIFSATNNHHVGIPSAFQTRNIIITGTSHQQHKFIKD